MTSMDPSDQSMPRTPFAATVPAAFPAGKIGRLLLLAVGGFVAVQLALALFHLG